MSRLPLLNIIGIFCVLIIWGIVTYDAIKHGKIKDEIRKMVTEERTNERKNKIEEIIKQNKNS